MTARVSAAAVIASETPPRWVESVLAQIARLEHLDLQAIAVAEASRPAPSGLAAAVLRLYRAADARAYPLAGSALDCVPLGEELRALVRDGATARVDWLLDLRDGADPAEHRAAAARGVITVRNELTGPRDRTVLDAIRRRSPVASVVEVVDAGGRRDVASVTGACHPLSLLHTLDRAYRRCEVLLVRVLRELR
jgi:hypothetical protein